jgi:hypothetical protein
MTNLVTPENYEIPKLAAILQEKRIMDGFLQGLRMQRDEKLHSDILEVIHIMFRKSEIMIESYIELDGNAVLENIKDQNAKKDEILEIVAKHE